MAQRKAKGATRLWVEGQAGAREEGKPGCLLARSLAPMVGVAARRSCSCPLTLMRGPRVSPHLTIRRLLHALSGYRDAAARAPPGAIGLVGLGSLQQWTASDRFRYWDCYRKHSGLDFGGVQ